jgi:hypothetical protein
MPDTRSVSRDGEANCLLVVIWPCLDCPGRGRRNVGRDDDEKIVRGKYWARRGRGVDGAGDISKSETLRRLMS